MLRFSGISLCLLALLMAPAEAWAQGQRGFAGGSRGTANNRTGFQRGVRSSGGSARRGAAGRVSQERSGDRTGTRARTTARGASVSAGAVRNHQNNRQHNRQDVTRNQGGNRNQGRTPNQAGRGRHSSFASRLGNNVRLRAVPPVTMHPSVGHPGFGHSGVGNINRPGVAPNGSPSHIPNINRPSGGRTRRGFTASDLHNQNSYSNSYRGSQHHRRGGYSRRGSNGSSIVFYYGIPYALPYYEPYGYSTYSVYSGGGYYSAPPPQPPEPAAPGTPGDPADVRLWPWEYQSSEQPPEQPTSQQPTVGTLTLLAFQDHTILAVTDYWLEGDILYYETSYGLQGSIPLDRLDLPLTQQLNQERNIPFVLESRR